MNPYQLAVLNSPDAFLHLSAAGQVLDVNPALCRLLDYEADALCELDFQTISAQPPEWLIQEHDKHVRIVLRTQSGKLVVCQATVVYDPEGTDLYLFLQCNPERFMPEPGELLTRLSHELRTPLHAVLGFAQLLERELEEPGQQAQLASLLDNARNLLKLIDGELVEAEAPNWEAGLSLQAPLLVSETLATEIAESLAPELREQLRQTLLPDWQRIAGSRSFDRVLNFARQVEGLARELDASRLLQYARELERSCQAFDPMALTRLMRQFPSLLEESRPFST